MKNETAKSADYKMVKFRDPATGKIKFRKVKHDDAIVQQETMDPRDFTDKPGHVVVVKKKDGTRKIKHYHPSSAGAKKYADRVNKVNRVGDKATVHRTDGRKIHGESFRYRPDPFKSRASLAKSAKYKEAEAEYQKDKEFARKKAQQKREETTQEEGYIGGKGEKGRDKGNAGKFDKNTAYSHAKAHNGVVHKDTSGSYLVKHGRGKNVSESVELDEAINFRKAHQEIMAYPKKHGDIDKEDFEKVASYIKAIGDNQNKPDRANLRFATMKAFVAGMDTDPRDKVYSWLKKYGMFKNGKMVQESESVDEVYRKPPTPIGGKGSSAKYKEAEAEYDREKSFARMRNQRKPIKKESSKEYGKSVDRIRDKEKKAKIKPSELDKLARLKNMMKNANEESVNLKTFTTFISELTAKDRAELAKRKAANQAKRGARRGPSKGTKSSGGDWTANQQKSAKALSFEIGKNDKHDAVHKTLAKAADASHPSLGGRKVTVKINGKSKEMAHKDLQHAVDLHKRLPLGKKAAVMNLIRDKGHDGVTAAANHFRKTYK